MNTLSQMIKTLADYLDLGKRIVTTIPGMVLAAGVLIFGPDVIPMFSFSNSIPGDDDQSIASDNPYGCAEDDPTTFLVPDLATGRVSGGRGAGVAGLIAHLDALAALHRTPPARSGAWALGCGVWDEFTVAVAQSMGSAPMLRTSPAHTIAGGAGAELGTRLLYFNLHGAPGDRAWFGADADQHYYRAVEPNLLTSADLRGAVVFAANCFGGAIAGRRTEESCALTAAAGGARAFIGATGFSFGAGSSSHDGPRFSDRLAQLFFQHYTGGEPAGGALRKARLDYVRENLSTGLIFRRERKTALQFFLLGDPTL
jgi:hypothetical protein